jgi:hypothetical protein
MKVLLMTLQVGRAGEGGRGASNRVQSGVCVNVVCVCVCVRVLVCAFTGIQKWGRVEWTHAM